MNPLFVFAVAAGLYVVTRPPAWRRAEQGVCERRGLRHRGRSGEPDCDRRVEVKHWRRPVDASTVRREYKKGRRELVATRGGFTAPAVEEARRLGMKLRLR